MTAAMTPPDDEALIAQLRDIPRITSAPSMADPKWTLMVGKIAHSAAARLAELREENARLTQFTAACVAGGGDLVGKLQAAESREQALREALREAIAGKWQMDIPTPVLLRARALTEERGA